ncbi:MAG: hypothetical protein ABJA02_10350 [Acidobacteriota bacterium]
MYIYVHSEDIADAGRTFSRHTGLDVRHVIVPGGLSVRQVAAAVLRILTDEERASPNEIVDLLLFNGHGSPGTIYIGEGIDEHNVSNFADFLRHLLKPIGSGGEGIEVHCCQVAAGLRSEPSYQRTCGSDDASGAEDLNSIGVRFIYAMARDFAIRVRASLDLQIADRYGFFEGSMVEALPGEGTDWHGHVRQLTSSPLLMEGDIDSLRWEATFGFY